METIPFYEKEFNMQRIPVEIWCEILKYLTVKEKLYARRIFRHLKEIIDDRSFYGCKKLYSISEEFERCKIARRLKDLFYKEVQIKSSSPNTNLNKKDIEKEAKRMSKLRIKLSLNSRKFRDEGVRAFCNFWGLNEYICKRRQMVKSVGRYSLEPISIKELNLFHVIVRTSLPLWVEEEIKQKQYNSS